MCPELYRKYVFPSANKVTSVVDSPLAVAVKGYSFGSELLESPLKALSLSP